MTKVMKHGAWLAHKKNFVFFVIKYAKAGVLFKKEKLVFLFDYITKRRLKDRKGYCNMCGACCKGCPFLAVSNKCSVYEKRSKLTCDIDFPISPYQLEMFREKLGDKTICTYYWDV